MHWLLFSHVVMFVGSLDMLCTASQYSLYQYSIYLLSIFPSCVASLVLCMPSAPEGVHPHMLLPVSTLWTHTLICSLMY